MTKIAKIPTSFIKEFVKANGEIDEVLVEYHEYLAGIEHTKDDEIIYHDKLKLTPNNEVIIHLPKNNSQVLKNMMFQQSLQWLDNNKDRKDITNLNEEGKMLKAFNGGVEEVLKFLENGYSLSREKMYSREEVIKIAEYVRVCHQSTPNIKTVVFVDEYLENKENL